MRSFILKNRSILGTIQNRNPEEEESAGIAFQSSDDLLSLLLCVGELFVLFNL